MSMRGAIMVAVMVLASGAEALAQDALLLYHARGNPKRLMLNPAAPVRHRAWLSLPIIGHADVAVQAPWAVNDVVDLRGTSVRALLDGTSAVPWEEVPIDVPAALDGLTPLGRGRVTSRVNLLSAGVNSARGLFFVNLDQQVDAYAAAGEGALAGLYFGEAYILGEGIDVTGYRYDASVRTTLALGYQYRVGGGGPWRVGGNLKIVKTQAHARLKEIAVSSEALPGGGVAVFYEGINQIAGFADVNEGETEAADLRWRRGLAGGNFGVGVDLGVRYEPDERTTISASVTDLGLSRYGYQTREYLFNNLLQRGTSAPLSEFETVTVERATAEVAALSREGETRALNDDAYTRPLPTTVYLGGQYRFWEETSVGAVLRNSMRGGRLQTAGALSLNLRPWRFLEANTSVGFVQGGGAGVGFGLGVRLAAVRVYAGTDNVLAFRDLNEARWVSAFAGVTLVLPEEPEGGGVGRMRVGGRARKKVRCYEF